MLMHNYTTVTAVEAKAASVAAATPKAKSGRFVHCVCRWPVQSVQPLICFWRALMSFFFSFLFPFSGVQYQCAAFADANAGRVC